MRSHGQAEREDVENLFAYRSLVFADALVAPEPRVVLLGNLTLVALRHWWQRWTSATRLAG